MALKYCHGCLLQQSKKIFDLACSVGCKGHLQAESANKLCNDTIAAQDFRDEKQNALRRIEI